MEILCWTCLRDIQVGRARVREGVGAGAQGAGSGRLSAQTRQVMPWEQRGGTTRGARGRDRSTTARPFLLEKSIHCSLPFSSLHVIRQWPPVSPKPKVSPKTAIILHPHGQPGPFHPLLCPPGGSHCLLLPRLSQSQTKTGHAGGNLREAAHGAALT